MRILSLTALLAAACGCDNKPAASNPAGPPATAQTGAPVTAAAVETPKGETTYYFGSSDPRTNITFESKTEITNIIGVTHKVKGYATIDFAAGTGKCEIEVPVLSLNTGMNDRDNAMLGKAWLDAKQFPKIEFKSEKGALVNKPATWKIDGKFSLKGAAATHSLTADVRPIPDALSKKAQLGDGSWVRVKTSFVVKLADHNIKIDEKQIATVQPEWNVSIDMYGTTVKPPDGPEIVRNDDPGKGIRSKPVSAEGITGTIYEFGKRQQLAQMTATSDAELETITASTKTLSGLLGLEKEKSTGKVRLRVPVAGLKTGIDLRDEHMLGADWLDGKQHPDILFESTKALKKDDKTWTIEGKFTMRGVSKPVTADIVLREIPVELVQKAGWGNTPGLGFNATFKIKLSDYGIKISEKAVNKVNDEWKVTFDLVALQKAAE